MAAGASSLLVRPLAPAGATYYVALRQGHEHDHGRRPGLTASVESGGGLSEHIAAYFIEKKMGAVAAV